MTTEPLDITVPTITVPTDLGERVVSQYTVQQLAAEVVREREARQRAERDLVTICDAIYQEANDRDWCDEYDEFAEKVNGECQGSPLRTRDAEYEYTVTVTLLLKRTQGEPTISDIERQIANQLSDYFAPEDVNVAVKKSQ